MKTAVLYIRVSTDEQTEFSPQAQKKALLAYASQHNYIVAGTYIDEGISGRTAEKRPQFMKMIAAAKSKEHPFDVILVHKFDRFARSREDSVVYKSLLRKECNVKVISVTETIEDDKFSVILEAMLEAMAEYYSLNLSDEVLKGMKEKASRGEYQSAAPIGYKNANKTLIIDPAGAAVVKTIYNHFLSGDSIFMIAQQLNAAGHRTRRGNLYDTRGIKYILENPVYKGYSRWGVGKNDLRACHADPSDRMIVKGNWEPIISEDIWQAVQKKLTAAKRQYRTRPAETKSHWLSGFLKCSSCGSTLASAGHKAGGFQCSAYSKGQCHKSHYISIRKIEQMTIAAISELNSPKYMYQIAQNKETASELELSRLALTKLLDKENKIKQAYINGIDTIDEYKQNKAVLQLERQRLSEQILFQEKAAENCNSTMAQQVCDVYSILSGEGTKEAKAAALASICDKIIYNKENEHIDIYLIYTY